MAAEIGLDAYFLRGHCGSEQVELSNFGEALKLCAGFAASQSAVRYDAQLSSG